MKQIKLTNMVNYTCTKTINKTNKLSFCFTLIALIICNITYSQETYKDSVASNVEKINDYEKVLKEEIYITGKVIDSELLTPVVSSTITINDLGISATTDSDGLYKIDISDFSKSIDSLTLKYEAKGYKTTYHSLKKSQLTNMFNIVDVNMESTTPQIVNTERKIVKKEPIHEQVLSKVKTIFKKRR